MKKFLVVLLMLVAMNANAQWQPDVRLTNDPAASSVQTKGWSIATNGTVLHVVWSDKRNGNYEIYYKRSTDAGISWQADTRLTNDINFSYSASVSVSGSVVHVVWIDDRDGNWEIYYIRSTDAGISWGTETRLTNNSAYSNNPCLAVSGSVVHVVWDDGRDAVYKNEIYYKRSTDAGLTWQADMRLTNDTNRSYRPSVSVLGSVVHVVWDELRGFGYYSSDIYYKRSTDAGVSWEVRKRLTYDDEQSDNPSVAVSGSFLHVAWVDRRGGDYEIYYKRSTDAGLTWGADIRLTNSIAFSLFPSIAVSGSVVHVVWNDERGAANVKPEIYYKRSTNSGLSWQADTRLTNDTANSYYPSIAVSGSVVHVVWQDNRNGLTEIYYKRNPTGNVGIQSIGTETPSKYSLSQNYPNPFNSTSNLKFQIVNSGDVKLVVYDIQGREVQMLVNERLQPGTYEAAFDASSLNSGVYFYKLITDGFTDTKKMLLIK